MADAVELIGGDAGLDVATDLYECLGSYGTRNPHPGDLVFGSDRTGSPV
jgi:hypothetical protein